MTGEAQGRGTPGSVAPPRLMEAAMEVARVAGAIALDGFRRGRAHPEAKADGSPVTEWDRAAERAARAWLEERFTADGILGEEFGETRPGARRRWLVDPIDGTRTFVRGVPLWGTLVAAVEAGEVVAGAAHFPALGDLLAAAPGAGCWWNGARCAVSEETDLARALVLTTDERCTAAPERRTGWERLAAAAGMSRSWGDCYGYLLLATGRAEAMVDPVMSAWDAAALVPIVEEAGGVITDWDGLRGGFGGSVVATNARLATRVRSLVRGDAA